MLFLSQDGTAILVSRSCLKLHEVSIVEKEIVMSISCLDNDLHCHLLGVSAICMVIGPGMSSNMSLVCRNMKKCLRLGPLVNG